MLVLDQIQEIAEAYVSCHTVREEKRKRWKDVYMTTLMMKEKHDVDTV